MPRYGALTTNFRIFSTCSKTALRLVPPSTSLLSTLASKSKTSLTSSVNLGLSVWSCSSVSWLSEIFLVSASRTAEPEM
jgi:hypothetical protein